MSKLCFHWDENQLLMADSRAQSRLLKQWTHTAKAFGVNHLLVIGSPPKNNDNEITIETFKSYQDVREKYDSQYIVITEKGNDVFYVDFPEGDKIYVVGSNYANPEINNGDITVSIKAKIPLFDLVAASIVMYEAQ